MPRIQNYIAQVRSFNRFYTSIIGLLEKHIQESDYSLSEVRILFEIASRSICTARQIKDTIRMDEGYLSRIIDKLVVEGLIRKRRSSKDARIFDLSLSAKGKRIFGALNRASNNEIKNLLLGLSLRNLQELVRNMNGIVRIVSGK